MSSWAPAACAARLAPAARTRPAVLRVRAPHEARFPDRAAVRRFRATALGRVPALLTARDDGWRGIAPGYRAAVAMAASGLPFQIAVDRTYDRTGDPRRLAAALARGATVFLPQVHQVLPRLMRLMVALRATFLGPFREECSFLFMVEGRGREGMGLHHDGEADQFWLQLDGCRTVTLGPAVAPGTPEDLPPRAPRRRWRTLRLPPGSLFYMPPRTPHRVLCRERSLAVSLTWKALDPRAALAGLLDAAGAEGRGAGSSGCVSPARYAHVIRGVLGRVGAAPFRDRALRRAHAIGLAAWDIVPGRVDAVPAERRGRLWAQVPAVAVPSGRKGAALVVDTGAELGLPRTARGLAAALAAMPEVALGGAPSREIQILVDHGILAARDLPLRVIPADLSALDGWRFA